MQRETMDARDITQVSLRRTACDDDDDDEEEDGFHRGSSASAYLGISLTVGRRSVILCPSRASFSTCTYISDDDP